MIALVRGGLVALALASCVVTACDRELPPDGQIVLVTILREGQRATVIQMPAKPQEGARSAEPEDVRVEQRTRWSLGV